MVSVELSLPIIILKCIERGCKKVQSWILVWNIIRLLTDLVFVGSPPFHTHTHIHTHSHSYTKGT